MLFSPSLSPARSGAGRTRPFPFLPKPVPRKGLPPCPETLVHINMYVHVYVIYVCIYIDLEIDICTQTVRYVTLRFVTLLPH